ncbi:MAG: hypothetical protein JW839_04565 [Candidatus Lokiarchaeota archaeon]|nr:hypothetical protein [Candidatus Lokiarchaeota archaeon]
MIDIIYLVINTVAMNSFVLNPKAEETYNLLNGQSIGGHWAIVQRIFKNAQVSEENIVLSDKDLSYNLTLSNGNYLITFKEVQPGAFLVFVSNLSTPLAGLKLLCERVGKAFNEQYPEVAKNQPSPDLYEAFTETARKAIRAWIEEQEGDLEHDVQVEPCMKRRFHVTLTNRFGERVKILRVDASSTPDNGQTLAVVDNVKAYFPVGMIIDARGEVVEPGSAFSVSFDVSFPARATYTMMIVVYYGFKGIERSKTIYFTDQLVV